MKEENKDFFEDTHGLITAYVEDRILLTKIRMAKKSGQLISSAASFLVTLVLLFFILLFVGLMGGYYFAEKLGSLFYGFSIVAGIYFVLLCVFLILNKFVFSKRIINSTIKLFFDNTDQDLEDEDDE